MPTYEYRCLDCNETFERVEHIDEHGEKTPACPECGGERVEPVMSSFFAKTSKKS
jgi:putative FmdB family regulatory protein